jgi:hypothetical protein
MSTYSKVVCLKDEFFADQNGFFIDDILHFEIKDKFGDLNNLLSTEEQNMIYARYVESKDPPSELDPKKLKNIFNKIFNYLSKKNLIDPFSNEKYIDLYKKEFQEIFQILDRSINLKSKVDIYFSN